MGGDGGVWWGCEDRWLQAGPAFGHLSAVLWLTVAARASLGASRPDPWCLILLPG